VFGGKCPKLTSMDKPWYRKLFAGAHKLDLKSILAKADQGDPDAQFGLGLKYSTAGGGVPDFVQAAQWYRKAADQNHCLAQFNLGVMYASGQGVLRDDAEAVMWIRKAAEAGDAGAQFNLGTRCHRASVSGQETDATESRIEAYKWLQLAAAQGYRNSDAVCERVILDMTCQEVTEGNHRTTRFLEAKPTCTVGE